MKYVILTVAAISSIAYASAINYAGTFSEPVTIAMMGYENEQACLNDKGQWQDDMCLFDTENTVVISPSIGGYDVAVDTVHTNGHSCMFEGKVTKANGPNVTAATEVEEWNDEKQEFEPATCELNITYTQDGNSLSLGNNGKCQSLCGARGFLAIDKADRK